VVVGVVEIHFLHQDQPEAEEQEVLELELGYLLPLELLTRLL
jgi:hypothetical protein